MIIPFLLIAVVQGGIFAFACRHLAEEKGKDKDAWTYLGFFFGIVALLVLGFSPSDRTETKKTVKRVIGPSKNKNPDQLSHYADDAVRECPFCAEEIKLKAVKCKSCGTDFDLEEVHQLVKHQTRDEIRQDPEGIHWCLKEGDLDLARWLISDGMNVNHRSTQALLTPLHVIAEKGDVEFATLLIAHGADVNSKNARSATPLYVAIENEQTHMVRLLLENGARFRKGQSRSYADSELLAAARIGNLDLVLLLFEFKVSPGKYPLNNQYSPSSIARRHGHVEVAEFLIEQDSLQWLVESREKEARRNRLKSKLAGATMTLRDKFLPRRTTQNLPLVRTPRTPPLSLTGGYAERLAVECPDCGHALNVLREYLGTTGTCNHCGNRITLGTPNIL